MQLLWDFLANNKDAVDTILNIFAFLGITSVTGVLGWVIQRWWKQRVRIDIKVFEVITDPALLLPKLYSTENDDSPLADHRIKYQPRDPKRDIQAELKAILNRSRYLLITAPTGYGKTREAGVLAQSLMLEGWRVLRIKTGWLDTPKSLPDELSNNRQRVLLFLDDLNGLFSTGELTQSPRAEQIPMLSQASYHDRLLQVLDTLEGMCTENEIRVIATARSEADQWELLNYNEKDKLWKRFERIEIPEPTDIAIVNLLEDSSKSVDLKANEMEFTAIAHRSDGTYRNILLNLRRWKAQNKEVSKEDFTETLDGSWRDIYERAVKRHHAVKYIYDAIDVLRQSRISLFPFLVEQTALIIWGGNYFQRLLRQAEIRRAIHYLTKETVILRQTNGKFVPSDGQIDIRQSAISWVQYTQPLVQLLLNNMDQKISISFLGLATALYNVKQFEKSHQLLEHYIQLRPTSPIGYTASGILLNTLKRNDEAETAYRKAIELNPDEAATYFSLGNFLQTQKRNDEAEAAYRKAIALNPDLTEAYTNLSTLLSHLKRNDEAENIYRKSIELNPDEAATYFSLGNFLQTQKRNDEAEAAYRKAIALNPDLTEAYTNLGNLLSDLKRNDEAEAAYRKAIELNPDLAEAYYNLGTLLSDLKRNNEAEAAYRKAIELNPNDAATYSNLGNLLSDLKCNDEAETTYRKAVELNPNDADTYSNLGNLLSGLKRNEEAEAAYRKAIELNPDHAAAYCNLGILLKKLKRNDEAEAAYHKAIELNPSLTEAYINLGNLFCDLKFNEEAENVYHKAIELNPNDAATYSNLGILLKKLKRNEEAEAAYHKAIELNPALTEAYSNLGSLFRDMNLNDKAEAAYRKAIELNPDEATDYSNLGTLLSDLNRNSEAEALYRKAVELDTTYVTAYNNLANLLYDMNRYDEAEATYRNIIELRPEDVEAYYNLGRHLADQSIKKYDDAEKIFFKALEFDSIHNETLYCLACIKSLRQETEAAFSYLQQAITNGFNRKWAWEDPDLQWIRDDPRFAEIVGQRPE